MGKTYRDNPFYKFLTAEQKEHAALVDWLNWTKKDKLWQHTVNEGKRGAFERYLWSIMGGKKSVPDFLFFDAVGGYQGLAVELKATGEPIYRKDGVPLADKRDQWEYLEKLKKRGWYATFAVGQTEAMDIIEKYYKGKL